MVAGDFNVVLSHEEKLRGCPNNLNDDAKFLSMIQQAGLSNLGFYGSKYTWSNYRLGGSVISKRLDMALAYNDWVSVTPHSR